MSKKLVSISEGAKYLKISPGKLRREVKLGRVPSMRIGWNYILKIADLDEYQNSSNGSNNN